MSSGLQRRRAAGASSAQDEDIGGSWGNTSPSSSTVRETNGNSMSPTNVGGHAGTAFEGGSKIAYDPRDLAQEDADNQTVGGRMPKLTIMEEILLLGIKDKQVSMFLVSYIVEFLS